jgi:hypothetical protein
MTRGVLVAVVLLGALLLADPSAAAPPCREHEIRLAPRPPGTLGPEVATAEIIDAAASVIRSDLELPFSPAYKAYVCGDEAAFSEGLLRHLGVRAVGRDWRIVPSAVGVATRVGVFLRGDYLDRGSLRRRVTVVAHELAHLSQQDMARNREDRLPTWMVEGHADWVALQVLDRLGLQTYGESRAGVVRSVAGAVTPVEHFPDLDTLADHDAWMRSTRSVPATYGQALLAVGYLIGRASHAAVVKFMSSAVEASDPHDRWLDAFSFSYREFADDFRAYLRTTGRRATGATIEPRPLP